MDIKNFVSNIKNENRIPRIIRRIAGKNISLKYDPNTSSNYCTEIDGNYFINLGLLLAMDEETIKSVISSQNFPDITYDDTLIRIIGAASHEASHVRFTDFNVLVKHSQEVMKAKNNVKEIAGEWLKTKDDSLFDEIKQETYNYLYGMFLTQMFNSLEDASIEDSCLRNYGRIPFVSSGINMLRNLLTDNEDEYILKNFNEKEKYTKSYIETVITEIRHMAVAGYRNYPCRYTGLANYTADEFEEMNYLALYARFNAKNSSEVFSASKVAMKFIENEIKNVANEYANKYIDELKNETDDDTANDITNDFSSEENDFAIAKKMANASTGTPPQKTPEFTLEIPDNLQEQIDNAGKETNNNTLNSAGDKKTNNNKNQEKTFDNSQDSNSEEHSETSNDNKQQKTSLEDYKKNIAPILDKQSKSELGKSYKELNKKKLNAQQKNLALSINDKGHTPDLNETDKKCLSDMHKGVKIRYFSPDEIYATMTNTEHLYEDITPYKKLARKFSKDMKRLLFRDSRIKKIPNLNRGKIDKRNLHRIVIDDNCFYNKIDGKAHKARFCILVDQSGSMGGSKSKNAYYASAMLAEACKITSIPLAVYGHNNTSDVLLYHYLDYKKHSKKYYDNLVNIVKNGGCNHDSIPIFYCLKDLVKNRKHDEKLIFIVISDGAPAGNNGYQGQCAFDDIRNIYKTFENFYGVETIGVGIGSDIGHIPQIYENHCLVPNVEELPMELLKIFKRTLQK